MSRISTKDLGRDELFAAFKSKYSVEDIEREATECGPPRLRRIYESLRDSVVGASLDVEGESLMRIPSWEAAAIERNLMVGSFVGFLYGSTVSNLEIVRDFKRKHALNVFHGYYEANRKLIDYLMLMSFKKGIYFGWRCGVLGAAMTTLSVCSISYHNDIRPLELSLLCGSLTALWRAKGGLRAASASGLIGTSFGLLFAMSLKATEYFSGKTVLDWRRETAQDHLIKQIQEARTAEQRALNSDRPYSSDVSRALNRDERIRESIKNSDQSEEPLFPTNFRPLPDRLTGVSSSSSPSPASSLSSSGGTPSKSKTTEQQPP